MNEKRIAFVLFALAVLLYLPALANGFAYDDVALIQLDSRVHSLAGIWRYFVEPYWGAGELGLYRPLTSVSFAVDWAVGGGDPAWFHFTNLLWNALACVAAFLLLATWFRPPAALAGALLFLVHPVHVEAVANVVGRAELMAGTFVLTALTIWARSQHDRTMHGRSVALVASLYVLALLAKESALVLPALVVLADVASGRLRPGSLPVWLRRTAVPLVVLLAVTTAFVLVRMQVTGGVAPERVDPLLDVATTPGARLLTALQVWPVIARLFFFPTVLLADYGPNVLLPALTLTPAAALGAALLLTAICGGISAWHRGNGRLALALLFAPVALLPVSNLLLPIGVLLAERTLYVPSFALAAAVALLLGGSARAAASLPDDRSSAATGRAVSHTMSIVRSRGFAVACTAVVTMLFATRTVVRIPDWQSTESIMRAQERDRPETFRVAWYDARAAVADGDAALALERYAHALDIWPHRRHVVTEAAAYAALVGHLQYARRLSGYAADRWPDDVANLRVLAGVSLDLADTSTARQVIGRGLSLAPEDSVLRLMRTVINPMND